MPSETPDRTGAVRAILFDMDDTIFDHSATAHQALAHLRAGVPALRRRSVDDIARRYGELLDEIFPSVLSGRATMEAARVERFVRLLAWAGETIPEAKARHLSDVYRAEYQKVRRTVPGATGLLRVLRGRAVLGIVSNNQQEEQLDKLRFLGLDGAFDFVMTSERAGIQKPHPGIFQRALAEAGVGPEEAVMVGDSWKWDVLGARSAGIHAVWFNRYRLPVPEPVPAEQLHSFAPAHVTAERLLLRPGSGP